MDLPDPISPDGPPVDGPPVDVPLLRRAVEWAEAEAAKPEAESEWNQGWYATPGPLIGRECGTAYCIAGWIKMQTTGSSMSPWFHDAAEHLGLTTSEAAALFNGDNTITRVRHAAERIAARAGERL